MKRADRYKPLADTSRSAEEMIADLIAGAMALASLAHIWNPEDVKAADIAAADATLVGLARVLGELRRARA